MGSNAATPLSALQSSGADHGSASPRRAWIAALALALLLHGGATLILPRSLRESRPVSVSLQPMSRADLDQLKQRWKQLESREQQLLLEKPAADSAKQPPPEDTKFLSDRNIRVDRQMRARRSTVLPRPGAPGTPDARPLDSPAQRIDLGKLGVPLDMTGKGIHTRTGTGRRAETGKTAGARRNYREAPPRATGAKGQLGSSQTILDDALPEGSQNLLNARESVYYSFYSRIYEAIAPVWESRAREVPRQRRLAPGDYITVVEIEIDRSGTLTDVRVLRSSGVPAFDRAVIDSWRKLARFPNPPQKLLEEGGDSVPMKWSFQFRLSEGAVLQADAPARAF